MISPPDTALLLFRKLIPLAVIDEESYEKSLIMYVNIGEPRHIAGELMKVSVLTAGGGLRSYVVFG
jgi:hypothetical protein